jgi:hypothetical protein
VAFQVKSRPLWQDEYSRKQMAARQSELWSGNSGLKLWRPLSTEAQAQDWQPETRSQAGNQVYVFQAALWHRRGKTSSLPSFCEVETSAAGGQLQRYATRPS